MTKHLSPGELGAFNIQVNLGSYEDEWDEIAPDLFYVYSRHIPDQNCNLGYVRDGSSLTHTQVKTLEQHAKHKERTPAIWQRADQTPPEGYDTYSQEVWMTADTTKPLRALEIPNAKVYVHSPLPTPEMAHIFDIVYCQGKGDVGYNSMASEYVSIYRSGVPNQPAKAFHIGVDIDGVCVAISNVNMIGTQAGLYSVAVHPDYRRRGLGRLVANEGIRVAGMHGAISVLLQTAAGSLMQKMYESIGFEPVFVSQVFTKKPDS